jgi:hypothetical protein
MFDIKSISYTLIFKFRDRAYNFVGWVEFLSSLFACHDKMELQIWVEFLSMLFACHDKMKLQIWVEFLSMLFACHDKMKLRIWVEFLSMLFECHDKMKLQIHGKMDITWIPKMSSLLWRWTRAHSGAWPWSSCNHIWADLADKYKKGTNILFTAFKYFHPQVVSIIVKWICLFNCCIKLTP